MASRKPKRVRQAPLALKTAARRPLTESNGSAASSLTKMLSILDLFTPKAPIWSTNDLIKYLETSRSTAYRYIKGLHAAGLIGAVGNGYYVLGPRIVELDLQVRSCDPLYQAGRDVLDELVKTTGCSAMLCQLFSNSVLCIREQLAPLSPENLFSRGQRRPLFFGAMSRIILAHLPNHRLPGIYERNAATIAKAKLGADWKEFKRSLLQMRKDGFATSYGEFNRGVVGVSAPIFNSDQLILGSVGVAFQTEELPKIDMQKTIASVKRAARDITQRASSGMAGMDLPPRAVG